MDDRKLGELRAIVEDFVATQEPVGSKSLAERHGLGVSPATVRNDMASLEDEGYITQPHTGAGSRGESRSPGPSAARSTRSSRALSTSTTSSGAASGCSRS